MLFDFFTLRKKLFTKKKEIQQNIPLWQNYPLDLNLNSTFLLMNEINQKNLINQNKNILSNNLLVKTNLNVIINHSDEIFFIQKSPEYFSQNYLQNFFFIRKFSFINFFLNNLVDVPICFKKSKSLKTKNFELPLLKLSNFFMRKGKREKILRFIFLSLKNLFLKLKNNGFIKDTFNFSWLDTYLTLNEISFQKKDDRKDKISTFLIDTETERVELKNYLATKLNSSDENDFWNVKNIDKIYEIDFTSDKKVLNEKKLNYKVNFQTDIINTGKLPNFEFFTKTFLINNLAKLSPIFSFFIYSVDKNIRKFSRGKSGKYSFVWKYIAPYKRLQLGMRLFSKDVKFYPHKKYQDRLLNSFHLLINEHQKTNAWKIKNFSYNFVFKNFRKSLMVSLKTLSKNQ